MITFTRPINALAEIKNILKINYPIDRKGAKRAIYRWLLQAHPDKRQGRKLVPTVVPCSTRIFAEGKYWFTSASTPGVHYVNAACSYTAVLQPPSKHIHTWSVEDVFQRVLFLKNQLEKSDRFDRRRGLGGLPRAFVQIETHQAVLGGRIKVRVWNKARNEWATGVVTLAPGTRLPHICTAHGARIYIFSRHDNSRN